MVGDGVDAAARPVTVTEIGEHLVWVDVVKQGAPGVHNPGFSSETATTDLAFTGDHVVDWFVPALYADLV